MRKKNGMTLVEVLVTIALMSLVTAGIFQFFFFGNRATDTTAAEANVMGDNRFVMVQMDLEIRQIITPHRAIVSNDGKEIQLDTKVHDDRKRVYYKFENLSLMRREIALDSDGNPTVLDADGNPILPPFMTVLLHVEPYVDNSSQPLPVFVKDDKQITVQFIVKDERDRISRPLEIRNVFTIRSQGEIK